MSIRIQETLHNGYAQVFEATRVLVSEQSDFQSILIFDSPSNGRVLALDGIIQLTTRDEFTYSEMLTHVPVFELMTRGHIARRAMIVGGGDGAVAEELLKHKTVQEVVMVEIDPAVIAHSRRWFQDVSGPAFEDPRLTVVTQDAFDYLKSPDAHGAFDIIIADRPDPVGPAEVLFSDRFYQAVADALSEPGVAVFQNGAPFYQPDELASTMPQLQRHFACSGLYQTVTPTYIGGQMALTWGSKTTQLGTADAETLGRLVETIGVRTDYYSAHMHMAAFAVPPWIGRLLAGTWRSECATQPSVASP